jgi:hypothetical protein
MYCVAQRATPPRYDKWRLAREYPSKIDPIDTAATACSISDADNIGTLIVSVFEELAMDITEKSVPANIGYNRIPSTGDAKMSPSERVYLALILSLLDPKVIIVCFS